MTLSCSNLAGCRASCNSGDLAACTRLAGMYQRAEGVAPSMTEAVKLYRRACHPKQKASAGSGRGTGRVPSYSWACHELSKIFRAGWMFEIEQDVQRADALHQQAQRAAKLGCQKRRGHDCYTEVEIEVESLRKERWPEKAKAFVTGQIIPKAERACRDGHVDSCVWLRKNAYDFARHKYIDDKKRIALGKVAVAQYQAQCGKNGGRACLLAGRHTRDGGGSRNKKSLGYFDRGCKLGNRESCARYVGLWIDLNGFGMDRKGPKFQRLVKLFIESCKGPGHAECGELVELYALGVKELGVAKNLKEASRLVVTRCMYDGRKACDQAGRLFLRKRGRRKALYNRARGLRMYEQACLLTPHGERCRLCDAGVAPTHRVCLQRKAWGIHLRCTKGQAQQCERVGDMFVKGTGVAKSVLKAATYYRTACDAAEKSACVTLKGICQVDSSKTTGMRQLAGKSVCHQSLIHSDFFYEAEWQYHQTGKATIQNQDGKGDTKSAKLPGFAVAARAAASGGIQLRRGSIDADLVMSIVLDRARQAAIRLVVSELRKRGGGKVPGYLRDLLTQAALLLADQGTLRREKFQDLAMTVVRAFIASNAVKTLYATDKELVQAKVWSEIAALNGATWKGAALAGEARLLRNYLVDWAYYMLGETKMFGRAVGSVATRPRCPFRAAQGKSLCSWLVTPKGVLRKKMLEKAVRVEAVLQAVSLAKLIQSQGGVDLRRFIEALGNARSIGDLSATPGLNLKRWEADIVVGFEKRLRDLEAQARALRDLLSIYAYGARTNWALVEKNAELARGLIRNPLFRARLGVEDLRQANLIVEVVLTNKAKTRSGGLGGGGGGPGAGATVPLDVRVDKIRQLIRGWRGAYAFRSKLSRLLTDVLAASKPLLALKQKVTGLRAAMRRLHRGRNVMRIDTVPLYGLSELRKLFGEAIISLQDIEKNLNKVYPGGAGNQIRMAQSAVIRLLSFFDLMDRVARKARHDQSLSDITSSLTLLGSVRDQKFTAPLFDVLEPVLHAIEGHKPMDANVLFAILSKVRLDSLIATLASATAKKPCQSNDRGTECWTVKVVHALQESIHNDGTTIRVDGGKFARRLAKHGDDFRRRHKGGTFFHLTIGFGGLYSFSPPKTMSTGAGVETASNRVVPLIGEQIGFGWASPTFWGDSMTAKAGVFASGILYRMLLDSSESEAVMISPFAAIDLYDLVELYVAPSLLIYPPIGDSSVGAKFGISFGLTVPLGAYLEKL